MKADLGKDSVVPAARGVRATPVRSIVAKRVAVLVLGDCLHHRQIYGVDDMYCLYNRRQPTLQLREQTTSRVYL